LDFVLIIHVTQLLAVTAAAMRRSMYCTSPVARIDTAQVQQTYMACLLLPRLFPLAGDTAVFARA
jgi:hypothetical protein